MKAIALAAAVALTSVAGALEFRIEGEHFSNKDAWTAGGNNGAVGKSVLYSSGFKKGDPSCAATGTYAVPAAGKYFVWVRTLDFGEGWRKTQIKINGQSIGKFGDGAVATKGKPEYKWKRALVPVELTEGQIKIELLPLSMSSRIDSLLFTDNGEFKPSDNAEEVTDGIEELESLD